MRNSFQRERDTRKYGYGEMEEMYSAGFKAWILDTNVLISKKWVKQDMSSCAGGRLEDRREACEIEG